VTPDGDLRPVALARGWRILDDSTAGPERWRTRSRPGLAALGLVAAFLALTVAGPLIGVAGSARAAGSRPCPDPPIADLAAAHPPTDPRPRLVWHGPRSDRVVALTFDDGWSAATLRRIFAPPPRRMSRPRSS